MLDQNQEIIKQSLSFWPSVGKRYKRKCDYSGETIVTNYSPKSRFPVYKSNYFYQDVRTPEYIEYNPQLGFFEQLKILQEKIPIPHMLGLNYENCNFCDDVRDSKNCFLSSSVLECESLFYSYRNIRCDNCINIVMCFDCQLCYSTTNCYNCYKTIYGLDNKSCSNSYFLYDCESCSNCFMCWNLRGKEFCIENKQYTKEEYEKKISQYDLGSRTELNKLKNQRQEHIKDEAIHPENKNIQSEKSTGNFLQNCKNVKDCMILQESQDCENCRRGLRNKNVKNSTGILDCENSYMIGQSSRLYNVKYSNYCADCKNSEYLDNCTNCEYCFACIGLKNKKYHIFNKEYSKENYEILISEIKENIKKRGEDGKFFPYNMAYTGYNTTLARLFFPDTKENITKLGGYREDEITSEFPADIKISQVPDNISQVNEDLAKLIFKCKKTGQIFNINDKSILVYQKIGIPISDIYYLENITEQFVPMSRWKKHTGKCFITGKNIIHYYPPKSGYKKILSYDEYMRELY